MYQQPHQGYQGYQQYPQQQQPPQQLQQQQYPQQQQPPQHLQQQQQQQPAERQWVSVDEYNYALKNLKLAHDAVETQRNQMEEQERQVALLRERITRLEGSDEPTTVGQRTKMGGSTVDDFSIKNAGANLERSIQRWSGDVARSPPASLNEIRDAALSDIFGGLQQHDPSPVAPAVIQALLRHMMAETVSEGIINCLIVTNSKVANVQLTRIHEHLFARDPTVACVWRRQTFSAATESCSPEMGYTIMNDHMPALSAALYKADDKGVPPPILNILDAAYAFSRMLHGSRSSSGGTTDAFYRAFVPEIGAPLHAGQVELVKRCAKSDRGEDERVGACVFPGLVKVSRGIPGPRGQPTEDVQTVVRRAQIICQCALGMGAPQAHPPPGGMY